MMLDQNQFFCLDLQNFKSLESGDVHQNFWSSESLALGLQNLQVFRSWRRSSELLSSETSALDFWANCRCHQKLTYFRIRNSVFRSASECYLLRVKLLMRCLLPQSQNLF